ncbi:MAG: caspase family protein [Microthrixaceae bacterium]
MKALFTIALCLTAAPAFARENYALLIGANQYPALEERWWLKGPANDVQLVATYLTTEAPVPFPAEHVTVLSDGVAGAEAPTLAAIRGAFAELTAEVQPGDFVYLHFSGHGTQAPAKDASTELDGLDELFLPVDIGPWSDQVGEVQNALVDDEIGALIDGLRAKGANVWAVFDSCHSGTATRAVESAEDDVRVRQLPPEALGIDVDAAEVSRSVDPRQVEAPFDAGRARGQLRRLLRGADQRGDAGEEPAQGQAGPEAAGRVHLDADGGAGGISERDLCPGRAGGAAALCGEEPGEIDALVRGRSGPGGLWRRGRGAGLAMAGRGDGGGVCDPGGDAARAVGRRGAGGDGLGGGCG